MYEGSSRSGKNIGGDVNISASVPDSMPSSQASNLDVERLPSQQSHKMPLSSPIRSSGRSRERRNPSITPRKFTRFFTPRNIESKRTSSSRQALHEITRPALNRSPNKSQPTRNTGSLDSSSTDFPRDLKRRKILPTPEPSPDHVYVKGSGIVGTIDSTPNSSPCERLATVEEFDNIEEEEKETIAPIKRIITSQHRGLSSQLLERSYNSCVGRLGREHYTYPVDGMSSYVSRVGGTYLKTDWQDQTSTFYSRPDDVHMSMSMDGPNRTIPFCTTSCNTNTLVAVGDEEGRVRLLESAKGGKPGFQDIFLAFRVHQNAIIDMSFSDDDTRLVTASGDQSARVVDMSTQTTISILGNHSASLKQVRFQPGANNHNVIATSSRDGSIQIWDLRCKGYDEPLIQIYAPVESNRPVTRSQLGQTKLYYGRAINSIYEAHRPFSHQVSSSTPADELSRGEIGGRAGVVSVTAIQFLSANRNHLLLSASEADSSVKLWDIRLLETKRRQQIPLSSTQQPQSHNKWRKFGISSLNLNTDGTRLYTLCKDNTVYAYSTAHLMLGQAPELAIKSQGRPGPQRPTQEGLGPLYGFRHPQFHATSFYVKSAIRKAQDGRSEMLSVGSSDGCAILFPTDERYFPQQQEKNDANSIRPSLMRSSSNTARREDDSIPISTQGTALIRGHEREVGSVAWTHNGELITVGDDFLVRCWREGDDARDLRTGGESGGRRWGSGWAEMCGWYDDDYE